MIGVRGEGEFREFVAASEQRLRRVAWVVAGGDGHRAQDLVQAALVKTFVHWRRAVETDPYAYARRALTTTAIDEGRRRDRERRAARAMRDSARQPPGHAGAVELRTDLHRALAELAPRQRAVVALRYLEDMSEADVADALGISLGTVKSTASRALPQLRAVLQDAEEQS